MPIVNGKYKNPGWVDGGPPAINATELNAISDTLENTGDKIGDITTTMRTDLGADYLLCNGDVVDKTQYPALWNVLPEVTPETSEWNLSDIGGESHSLSRASSSITAYGNGEYLLTGIKFTSSPPSYQPAVKNRNGTEKLFGQSLNNPVETVISFYEGYFYLATLEDTTKIINIYKFSNLNNATNTPIYTASARYYKFYGVTFQVVNNILVLCWANTDDSLSYVSEIYTYDGISFSQADIYNVSVNAYNIQRTSVVFDVNINKYVAIFYSTNNLYAGFLKSDFIQGPYTDIQWILSYNAPLQQPFIFDGKYVMPTWDTGNKYVSFKIFQYDISGQIELTTSVSSPRYSISGGYASVSPYGKYIMLYLFDGSSLNAMCWYSGTTKLKDIGKITDSPTTESAAGISDDKQYLFYNNGRKFVWQLYNVKRLPIISLSTSYSMIRVK